MFVVDFLVYVCDEKCMLRCMCGCFVLGTVCGGEHRDRATVGHDREEGDGESGGQDEDSRDGGDCGQCPEEIPPAPTHTLQ